MLFYVTKYIQLIGGKIIISLSDQIFLGFLLAPELILMGLLICVKVGFFVYLAVPILFIEHMLEKVREYCGRLLLKHHLMQNWASHQLFLLMKLMLSVLAEILGTRQLTKIQISLTYPFPNYLISYAGGGTICETY